MPRRNPHEEETKTLKSDKLALLIAEAALDKKSLNLEIIDVHDKVDYTDYVVVCSASTPRQVHAIASHIDDKLRGAGARSAIEGLTQSLWVLLDFGDVVVHVFHHPLRSYYDIEGLWMDARRMPVDFPAELRVANLV